MKLPPGYVGVVVAVPYLRTRAQLAAAFKANPARSPLLPGHIRLRVFK